jgi:hypothetical protein
MIKLRERYCRRAESSFTREGKRFGRERELPDTEGVEKSQNGVRLTKVLSKENICFSASSTRTIFLILNNQFIPNLNI